MNHSHPPGPPPSFVRASGHTYPADHVTWHAVPLADQEQLMKDAARYRWLREQHWSEAPLCVLSDPKTVLTRGTALGADCPSCDRLDAAIDAAMLKDG